MFQYFIYIKLKLIYIKNIFCIYKLSGLKLVPLYHFKAIELMQSGLKLVQGRGDILEQKIKQDSNGNIGRNIRAIRKSKGIGQTELVRLLDLQGISITRECLVKIERGVQHIQVEQLKAIKEELGTTYDELLK